MKKHSALMILVGVLILSMAIAGCQTNNRQGVENTQEPAKTQQPEATLKPTVTPETSPKPAETNDQGQSNGAFEELKALLPEKEGYTWVYNGFAEYGHKLVLKEINSEDGKTVYKAEGEVFDMSDGASKKDYSLSANFTVTPQSIVQDKFGEMMMDSYDHMVLLQAPLKEGEYWTQTVKTKDGTDTTLKCTIEKIEESNGNKAYTVAYQDENSPYYEKRVIKEGVGVVNFTKLFITDEGSYEITYFLYEEASGYGK